MTEKEMKAKITQAHIDGYNRGFAKAKDKIADIKANCDLAIEGRDVKIKELEKENAELKERLAEVNLNGNIVLRELTKAKELLKETQGYIENIDDILYDEIEQFIME